MEKRKSLSVMLIRISIIAYSLWALLPTLQAQTRTYGAAIFLLMFALGLLLDTESLKKHWLQWLLRGVAIGVFILAYTFVLDRGGDNKKAIIILQILFWFSIYFFGVASEIGNKELWKYLGTVLLCVLSFSSMQTSNVNLSGLMTRDAFGNSIAFSRVVSNGLTSEGEVLIYKLLGVNGYGYIYGLVFALPFFCCAAGKQSGGRKLLAWMFIGLQLVTILMSQFLTAIVLAAAIMGIELFGWIARRISRNRLSLGKSLWIGTVPLLLLLLLLPLLVSLAASVVSGMDSPALSSKIASIQSSYQNGLPGLWAKFQAAYAEMLHNPPPETLPDGSWNDIGRLRLYLKSLIGFLRSPFVGSLFGGTVSNGIHSDILDSLSTCGILGTALMAFLCCFAFAPCLKELKSNADRGHVVLALVMFGIMLLLNPVFSYEQISLLLFAGCFYTLRAGKENPSTDASEASL